MAAASALPDPITTAAEDPIASAQAAGLRYVTDRRPGIRRARAGNTFRYVDAAGRTIDDPQVIARIAAMAIPPAWTDVWICPHPGGHIQATARDAKGRKQYRYHPRWCLVRDENKFDRLLAFGEALPAIRGRTEHDLALRGIPKEKVLATVVQLLEITRIRVGNAEYARQNRHFGLTTMRQRHVQIDGTRLKFHFVGKSGKEHTIGLRNRRLARIVKRCQELPGHELFQYVDDEGQRHTIESADVNAYLRESSGQDFTAKDFRTWAGTVLAAQTLLASDVANSEPQAKKNVLRAIASVAEILGNTPTVCRQCYIHPGVIDAYLDGSLPNALPDVRSEDFSQWTSDEVAVLALLRRLASATQSP
jgi:DNA topoisomerase I